MKKDYAEIGVNMDDDIPLDKPLKFPTLILITRCIFEKCEELCPQI